MVGTDVGDLKVILFDSNIWNYRLKLTRSGPQIGGEWLKYEKTVTMYKHTYVSAITIVNIWLVLYFKIWMNIFLNLINCIRHVLRSFYFTVLTYLNVVSRWIWTIYLLINTIDKDAIIIKEFEFNLLVKYILWIFFLFC